MGDKDVRTEAKELSNWGRWGPEDEKGTVNLITANVIRHAATLVRKGKIFSLAIPFDSTGPQVGAAGRINPVHLMTATGGDDAIGALDWPDGFRYTDDFIFMPLQCATQWDGLSHVFYDKQLYNGYPSATVSSFGAAKNSIDKIREGILTRGVLLDIARHRGVEWLEGGDAIYPDELDACAQKQGVEVRSGDAILFRTGRMTKFKQDGDRAAYTGSEPGLTQECARWMRDHDISAVAADTYAIDVTPYPEEGKLLPFHMLAIRDMGMTLGEIFDLDGLATDCAEDGVYEFLFVAAPLPVTGAVGSPINPLAVK
jgi:kynurenine formamidase